MKVSLPSEGPNRIPGKFIHVMVTWGSGLTLSVLAFGTDDYNFSLQRATEVLPPPSQVGVASTQPWCYPNFPKSSRKVFIPGELLKEFATCFFLWLFFDDFCVFVCFCRAF